MDMDASDKKFHCKDCQKSYKRKSDLNRHYRTKREAHICGVCNHKFNRKDNYLTHFRRYHGGTLTNQTGAGSSSTRNVENQSPSTAEESTEYEHEITQSINANVTSIKIKPSEREKFDLVFYSNIKNRINELIVSHSPSRKGLKWYLVTRVEFTRERDGEIEMALPHFRSRTYQHLSSEEFNMHSLNESFQKMFTSKEEFIMKGSDWILSKVIHLELYYVVYSPLKGGKYIREPNELRSSKSLVNIKNKDQKCFLYSVLAKLYPASRNPSRVSHYHAYANKVNMRGIEYPVRLAQISKFENQNDISVNVFGYEDKEIFPMRVTKVKKKAHVDLLYLKRGEFFHYCLIKNLNRFLYRTEGVNSGHSHKYCPYCLHGFFKQRTLDRHIDFCMSLGEPKI